MWEKHEIQVTRISDLDDNMYYNHARINNNVRGYGKFYVKNICLP